MLKTKNIISLLLSIMLIFSLAGCKSNTKEVEELPGTEIAYVIEGKNTWNVQTYEDSDSNQIIEIYKNNKLESSKNLGVNKHEYSEPKQLVEMSTTNDFEGVGEITTNVYSANISQSFEYVNYLKESGYTIEFQASTSEFIELYMKKPDGDNYKRLIIKDTYCIVYETDQISFNNINDYIIEVN